ncbi:hypothetical protein M0811_11335 [Anaeramoeba ignava]|uniref:Uncharacterized protein n=1 Tax=Anaeramoeba ignava TaxID=1746090 RepID=A0A9Q0LCL9_ANAIG|nr:hypothetical protein M0811_11335 [Anaeramoeba ignava]
MANNFKFNLFQFIFLIFLIEIRLSQVNKQFEFKFNEGEGDIAASLPDQTFFFSGVSGNWLYPSLFSSGVNLSQSNGIASNPIYCNCSDLTQGCGLNSTSYTEQASLEFWFLQPLPNNFGSILFEMKSHNGYFLIAETDTSKSPPQIQIWIFDPNQNSKVLYSNISSFGFLNHIVFTYKKNGNFSTYYNGTLINSIIHSDGNNYLTIPEGDSGMYISVWSKFMYLGVYGSELSSSYILSRFNNGPPPAPPSILINSLNIQTNKTFQLKDIISLESFTNETNDTFILKTIDIFDQVYGYIYTFFDGIKGSLIYIEQELIVNLSSQFLFEGNVELDSYITKWNISLFDETNNFSTFPNPPYSIQFNVSINPPNPYCSSLSTYCINIDKSCQISLIGNDQYSNLDNAIINSIPLNGSIYQILSNQTKGSKIISNDTIVDYRSLNNWSVIYEYEENLNHSSQQLINFSYFVTNNRGKNSTNCNENIIIQNFLQVNNQKVNLKTGKIEGIELECESILKEYNFTVIIENILEANGANFYSDSEGYNTIKTGSTLPQNSKMIYILGGKETIITINYSIYEEINSTIYYSTTATLNISIPNSPFSNSPSFLFNSLSISISIFFFSFFLFF